MLRRCRSRGSRHGSVTVAFLRGAALRHGAVSELFNIRLPPRRTATLPQLFEVHRHGPLFAAETEGSSNDPLPFRSGSPYPPPPPIPPPKPSTANSNTRQFASGSSNPVCAGSSRRAVAWPTVSTRTSPSGSRPSSPRSHGEGYNSADEQNPCFVSSYDDAERERQFVVDFRRSKDFEVKRMLEDGNCLFCAVADHVYGDSEVYDLIRQMCIDYMERERDHFSQFITGFTSYCKRKRRDKVYGNNVEIQAMSEMYNRPIHIYSYSIGSREA